jgi:hypothetical protein
MVHDSILMEGKNSTREGGGEGHDIIVSGAPKIKAVTPSSQNTMQQKEKEQIKR